MLSFPRPVVATLILSVFVFVGCEPGAPSVKPGPETPHNGVLFPIPDGQGFVEILKQPVSGNAKQSQLVAYFLDSYKKTLAATPTAVALKTLDSAAPIEFKPTGEADPSKAGALASNPFPDRGDIGGDLSATIDGKTITVAISLR
jgi:hypothetical protein